MQCDFIRKQTLNDKLYYNRVLMVDIRIEYPSISGYEGNTGRFNLYYRQKARKNYRYASTKLYQDAVKQYKFAQSQGYPFNAYEFVEVFEATYCKNSLVSLYYDIYEFTGGAHGNTTRKGNTWDMRKGEMLSMGDLFAKNYDYKSVILKHVEAEARRRQITGMATYFENMEENIRKYFDEANFYLTEEGLAVFYPLYSISPYADGIQVFIIPYLFFGENIRYDLGRRS